MHLSLPMLMVLAAGLAASACASKIDTVNIVSSPYSNGATHTEPVFYNNKHYAVSFRYNPGGNLYDVTVAGKAGRGLGSRDGDRSVVESIASSTVRHFACANGQKSAIVPGSTSHDGGKWSMKARCA